MLARQAVRPESHIDDSVPRPVVMGTDIKVSQIAREVVQMGMTPSDVVAAHPHLTLADVHAALSYYYDHAEELRADWAEDAARPEAAGAPRTIPWDELKKATGIARFGGGNAVEDCDALYDDA